ncbi:MAG: AAA family ATPase [Acidobacteriia bacterium]|nr:AAA family ATPase [Terriglobia bacterium]
MSARIQFFGNPQFSCDGTAVTGINTNRLQSLLAFLLLRAATPQSREQLASLLWPESNEGQARTNLRQLLHHLRRALPASCCLLISDNHTVQWPRDPACTVDVHEFDEAVERAAEAERKGDWAVERAALEAAAGLYQDELARGLYDDWLTPLRDEYRQEFAHVLGRLAVLLEERGDFQAAIRHAERLVAQDPLREAHHQLLIRLHIGNHDRASALRAYHQCMRALRRELGVDPDPVTRELYQRALKSEASTAVKTAAPPSAAASAMPIVGREREWKQLLDCWRLVESGKTHLAVIMGEPGIGKSRLAEKLYDWCASHHDGAVARARCYAAHGQLAYAPIAEWLRTGPLRKGSSQLPRTQLEEVVRVLPEILADNPSIPRPRPLTESWERRHFFEALHATFGHAPHPLLLVIDDLQWCDQDTIDYLHALFRSNQAGNLLVLATMRPEETDRNHPATRLRVELARARQVTEIPLEPLSAPETSALAQQIASYEVTQEDLADLYRTTKGNPLFVVECIRAGLRNPDAERRIHAVIGARLAQLSPSAFELAGLAAAVGQSFSFDLLAKASDWDEDSLSRALDELWHRRLIEGLDGALYDFTHDRIREVARAELSPIRRRFFHRRIARALEELHAGDLASVSLHLAAHYDDAGMPHEAIAHYRQAATVAQQRFADKEAAEMLRRALELCGLLPESAKRDELELELLVTLGPTLATTLGYGMEEVGQTNQRALELSKALGEKKHLAFILSGSWVFHIVRGELETARGFGQQLLDFAAAEANEALVTTGQFTLGCSLFHLGQLALSHQHMARTMSMYGNVSHAALALFAGPDVGVFCRSYLAHLLWHAGRPDQAVTASQEAIAAASRVGNPFSMAIALDYAALLYVFRRDSKAALEHARNAISVCRKHDFAYYRSIAEIVAGWAAAIEDDPQAGLAQLRRGLDLLKTTGAELRLPFYQGLLAEACALNGNMGEALANLSTGFAFQNKNGEMWSAADLHRTHGDLLEKSGNTAQARLSYQKSIEAARQAGSIMFELRGQARLAGLTGELAGLRQLLQKFDEGFDTPDLQQARALLGRSGSH